LNPNDNNKNKFLFDLNNFDTPEEEEEIIIEEELVEVEPPVPTFSEDEMEAAKIMAQSHGRSEGMREERAKREQHLSENLQKIAENFDNIFAAELYREKQYEEESVKLGLAILDQLAPSLNERFGKEELQTLLKDVLLGQSDQTEIRVEVHPDYASDIDQFIEDLWAGYDNTPRCKVVANSEIELGGCELTWKDGGLVRDTQKMATDIKEALENLLQNDAPPSNERKDEGKEAEKTVPDVTNAQNNDIKESVSNNMPAQTDDSGNDGEQK